MRPGDAVVLVEPLEEDGRYVGRLPGTTGTATAVDPPDGLCIVRCTRVAWDDGEEARWVPYGALRAPPPEPTPP